MILNEIHKTLIQTSLEDHEIINVHGFSFEPKDYKNRAIEMFQKGHWNLVPFAFMDYYNFAINMNPTKSLIDSRVVYFGKNDPISFSPNIKSFVPFFNLQFLNDPNYVSELKNRYGELGSLTTLSSSIFDPESLHYLKEVIYDDDLIEKVGNDSKAYDNLFRSFWNHYDASSTQKSYDEILGKLINLPRFLPDIQDLQVGDWNNRISSLVACKAIEALSIDFHEKQELYWHFLTQPNGIDAVDALFVVPDSSCDASRELIIIAEEFDTDPYMERTFLPSILDHPLYEAIQEIRLKKRTYLGEKHIEAAKVFDVEYNDPISSWIALVSGSYWAGKSRSEAVVPMWEAAIYLSEKSGWKEIHSVLVQQFEFYQKHK